MLYQLSYSRVERTIGEAAAADVAAASVRAEVRTLLAALGSFERTKIQTRAFLPVVTW